ncbi:MAG: hypothetical protein AAB782_01790 [Patescibacteria group bacterium]
MTKEIFVSRRLQCGAALAIIACVMLMVVAGSIWIRAASEEPREALAAYNRLAEQSRELDRMALELRELDWLLARNWMAARLENRLWLQGEVNVLSRKFASVASNYNWAMRESGYRFADPARLPPSAEFGPLPKRYEPFILLKGGQRA